MAAASRTSTFCCLTAKANSIMVPRGVSPCDSQPAGRAVGRSVSNLMCVVVAKTEVVRRANMNIFMAAITEGDWLNLGPSKRGVPTNSYFSFIAGPTNLKFEDHKEMWFPKRSLPCQALSSLSSRPI